MDIKIKGTTRAGVIVYDLNDVYARSEMKSAQNITNIKLAVDEFLNNLRTIRKYESVPDVNLDGDGPTDAQIIDTEEYYRALFMQALENNEATDVLDLL